MLNKPDNVVPTVAVAILNYNGKHYLGDCLSSLEKQSYPNFEVFVIDNASTDYSVDWVKQHFPSVKIISFDENLGFSKAYNKAVKMLDFEYIVFLNNDTQVTHNWLSELIKPMLRNESIGVCGSKILLLEKKEKIAHAGGKLTFIGSGLDIDLFKPECESKTSAQFVGFMCGASMLVRKSTFVDVRIDGFDQDYFSYHEDVDLCWRMWLNGYKVAYVPTSRLYHKGGGSWGSRTSFNRIFQSDKNRLINVAKNFSPQFLLISFPFSSLFSGFQIMNFLKKRNIPAMKAILKAQSHFFHTIRATIYKRRKIQSYRVRGDCNLMNLGLIANVLESFREYKRLLVHG
jgi:hypothetical protein